MSLSQVDGDLRVKGRIYADQMSIPAGAVSNAGVAADASIDASKLKHEHRGTYSQDATTNAFAEEKIIHIGRGNGTVESFEAGLVTPSDTAPGSSGRTATINLKKNGVSILSATIQLDNANVAYVPEVGAISASPFVDNDVFTVAVTVGGSAGTHCKGVHAQAKFYENP